MKTALITGGNSEIAFTLIEYLYRNGWNIIATDNIEQEKKLRDKIEKIRNEKIINKIESVAIDYLNENLEEMTKSFLLKREIDVLINVAGINILKDFMDFSKDELDRTITINATSTLLFTQIVAKNMITNKKEGNILFIGSQHGMVANYQRVPYSISKSILIQMTKSLALELASFNIRVNCISPTFIKTETNKDLLNSPYFLRDALERIPLKKYGTALDIREAILFLIDEKSGMITGHNLVIDGGWTIQ